MAAQWVKFTLVGVYYVEYKYAINLIFFVILYDENLIV